MALVDASSVIANAVGLISDAWSYKYCKQRTDNEYNLSLHTITYFGLVDGGKSGCTPPEGVHI